MQTNSLGYCANNRYILFYANFIPNDQKYENEGTTGLPSLEVMVLKNMPPEMLT